MNIHEHQAKSLLAKYGVATGKGGVAFTADEAEKVAQANVIKRREETAATRSLLNTAKLMDENPTLMRLKELEALEKVAEKVDRLTVFGGLDGVLKDTVRIGIKAN